MCSVRSHYQHFLPAAPPADQHIYLRSAYLQFYYFCTFLSFSFFHFSSLSKTFIYCCFEEKSLLQFPCETKPEGVLQKGWRRTLSLHG